MAIIAPPLASIGDRENLRSRPTGQEHCHGNATSFQANMTLEYRLTQKTASLSPQAEGMPVSVHRAELLRKARQMDAASELNRWLTSPGLRAPT